jgi:hypothetical protein
MRKTKRIQEKIDKGYCSTCATKMAKLGYATCEDCLRQRKIRKIFGGISMDSLSERTLLTTLQKGLLNGNEGES